MSRTGWRALFAALPDGLTAAAFAAIWLSPFVFGEAGVRTAMLVMLLEFFLIHATGFFTAFVMAPGLARGRRVAAILGLSLFYLLMIGALASSFGEWWPLLAFGWLVAAKLAWVYARRPAGDEEDDRGAIAWAGSGVAYVLGAFATAVPPVPRLGMTETLQPGFGLGDDAGGLWMDEPQRVIAFGVLYFGLLCLGKLLAALFAGKEQKMGSENIND